MGKGPVAVGKCLVAQQKKPCFSISVLSQANPPPPPVDPRRHEHVLARLPSVHVMFRLRTSTAA